MHGGPAGHGARANGTSPWVKASQPRVWTLGACHRREPEAANPPAEPSLVAQEFPWAWVGLPLGKQNRLGMVRHRHVRGDWG